MSKSGTSKWSMKRFSSMPMLPFSIFSSTAVNRSRTSRLPGHHFDDNVFRQLNDDVSISGHVHIELNDSAPNPERVALAQAGYPESKCLVGIQYFLRLDGSWPWWPGFTLDLR